jgi:putative hemolysin
VTDSTAQSLAQSASTAPNREEAPYDGRNLSYAKTFTNTRAAYFIRTLEVITGKLRLLRLIRRFEKQGVPEGQAFWRQALDIMGIRLETPPEQIEQIPPTGPVIVVANHPHGLVDGMVLADLIGRVRTDYKILTRSLLTDVEEVADFLIPVPFPHEDDALKKNLVMRKQAMAHLAAGGVIMLFPAGGVASSETWFGPAVETEWSPFTAKMIQCSNATVVPIRFTGQNSRLYQIANQISPVLRQGLLLHEVVHALNKPQAPIIGAPIPGKEIEAWKDNPRGFMTWLRARTLALT